MIDRPGGIFVRTADHITPEDRVQTVARVVIVDNRGTLAEQIKRRVPPVTPPLLATTKRRQPEDAVPAVAPPLT